MFNKKSKSIIYSILQLLIITLVISTFVTCDEDDNNGYTGPWVEVPTPGGCGHLNACYFNSSDDGWACGSRGDGPYPVLIHWNGVEWEEYPYGGWFGEEDFGDIALFDISFSGPNDGWCVGNYAYEHQKRYGIILRYDGEEWYLFEENLGEQVSSVYTLTTDNVWFNVFEGGKSTLYNWNGKELIEYYTNTPNDGLSDIDFYSSDNGLAVGDLAVVYHWNGSFWEELYYDPLAFTIFMEVSFDTPTTAYIVGENWVTGENELWRYDGGDIVRLRDWQEYKSVRIIDFISQDNGWIFGYYYPDHDPLHGIPCTWHWNGDDWILEEGPDDMVGYGIYCLDYYNIWIVGMKGGPLCCSWRYMP